MNQIIQPGLSPRSLLGLNKLSSENQELFSGKGVQFLQIEFDIFEDHKSFQNQLRTWPNAPSRQRERLFEDIQHTVHATAVASIVKDNDFGIAPAVDLHFYGAVSLSEWKSGRSNFLNRIFKSISSSTMYRAGDIVSISLQMPYSQPNGGIALPLDYDDDIRDMLNAFVNKGFIVFIAAGNSSVDLDNYVFLDGVTGWSSSYSKAHRQSKSITVGYCSFDRTSTLDSNYGRCVDIFIPAESVEAACYSFDPNPGSNSNLLDVVSEGFRRTSAATPMAAAFAAAVQSACRKLSRGRNILESREFIDLVEGAANETKGINFRVLFDETCQALVEKIIGKFQL